MSEAYVNRVRALSDLGEYVVAQFSIIDVPADVVAHDLNVAVRMLVEQAEGDKNVVVPAEANERVMNFFHLMRDAVDGTFTGSF